MPRRPVPSGKLVLVETTLPDSPAASAAAFAKRAVRARWAACANVVRNVDSFYWWNGTLERAREALVLFKTTPARARGLLRWIRDEHPHAVPYVAAFRVRVASPAYAHWADQETRVTRTGRARRKR